MADDDRELTPLALPPAAQLLALQRSAGNQAVARLIAERRDGEPHEPAALKPAGGAVLARQHVIGPGPVQAQGDEEYRRVFADYQRLLEAGGVHELDKADVDHAISRMNEAARELRAVQSKGSTAMKFALGGLAVAGVLLADDATGVGVVDDLAIPPVLIAAGVAALLYVALRSSDSEVQAAAARLNSWTHEATEIMTGILAAANVGAAIASNVKQLAKHLARFTNTPVGGQDPDHQGGGGRDKPHWWTEIKNFVKVIADKGLSPKQLARELLKAKISKEMIEEILRVLARVAEEVGEEAPKFPPIQW